PGGADRAGRRHPAAARPGPGQRPAAAGHHPARAGRPGAAAGRLARRGRPGAAPERRARPGRAGRRAPRRRAHPARAPAAAVLGPGGRDPRVGGGRRGAADRARRPRRLPVRPLAGRLTPAARSPRTETDMQNKRDQVHAHRFVMSRLSAAVLQAEPDAPSSPMRRFSVGTFAGTMIAVVVVAGYAVFGLIFHGGSKAFTQPNAIIVEKETGSRFLLLDGTLHPVLNTASARLLTGSQGHVVAVSAKSLRGLPHGAPIGIPGAPDNLPDPAHLGGSQWLGGAPHP